ncbi:MAG TPA: TIGR03936 family radical SAM-associated protein [Acidimicrobiales bacterium]|nr:TIGR03936 family radical SAM-associated protein [Acidimicrobiales bacterium]
MRLRFRFVKTGKVRWTSHRDVARMWERAFRRVQLPLAYSQGFSPRPKVSFGLALPTGAESLAEYLDVELAAGTEIDADALPDRLSAALPAGVDVTAAGVLDAGAASLQSEVTSCCWSVTVTGLAPAALVERVAAATAAASLVVSRERKGVRADEDIRPGIIGLRLVEPGTGLAPGPAGAAPTLACELATMPRALRPSELLLAMGVEPAAAGVCRTSQWIERDGARREPLALPVGATAAPHAVERAS